MNVAGFASLCLVASCVPSIALAQVKIPYFKKLTADDVCGGFSKRCQPKSSYYFTALDGTDLGELSEWLGTKFTSKVLQRSSCPQQFSEKDYWVSGENQFSGKLDKKYEGKIRSILSLDVSKYLSGLMVVLPPALQSKLKADAIDKLATASAASATFVYKRYDLKMPATAKLLPVCIDKGKAEKFITGVSVVTISGDWAKSKIIDSFGQFEATADFIGLDPNIKADYLDQRSKIMAGTFQPMSLVVAVAWRSS